MIRARRRMRRGERRRRYRSGEQGRMRYEGSGKDRSEMAATVRGMHEGMQQVDALFLHAYVVVMMVGVRRLHMLGYAVAGFVQIPDCGEYGIDQHRKHEQCQRGKAQQPNNVVMGHANHQFRMLRDAGPVKQSQHWILAAFGGNPRWEQRPAGSF